MTISSSHDRWVKCPKPNSQAYLRLFCFPYAGSGVSIFRDWPNLWLKEIEMCFIQLPGREERLREPSFTQLLPLVQTLISVLHPYLNKPFAFFGHSLGALISFELARQLRRQNEQNPVHLFISGCRAPQRVNTYPKIHHLPDIELIDELIHLNGTPQQVLQNAEMMELILPIIRADLAMIETYKYIVEEPLEYPISAFGGLDDDEVSRDDLIGWCDQTRNTFELRMFQGDHFFLHSNQLLLLQGISSDIRRLLHSMTKDQLL